jgi:hypothetical protein
MPSGSNGNEFTSPVAPVARKPSKRFVSRKPSVTARMGSCATGGMAYSAVPASYHTGCTPSSDVPRMPATAAIAHLRAARERGKRVPSDQQTAQP